MNFSGLDGNELTTSLEPGETLYFDLHYLRSPKFSRDMTPHFWEALVPRLLSGKLWEPHLTAGHEGDLVLLSGSEPYGRFHVVVVEPGRKMFVRLKHLVGYAFNDGGKFSSSFNLLDPVRWLIGAPTSVFLHGPASLIFYGRAVEDVIADAGEECFADQIHAFSAEAPFQVSGYLPQGTGFWADLINTISTTVNMTFLAPVRLVKTTIRQEHTNRLGNLWRLVFVSILLGWLFQRLVFSGVDEPPPRSPKVAGYRSGHCCGDVSPGQGLTQSVGNAVNLGAMSRRSGVTLTAAPLRDILPRTRGAARTVSVPATAVPEPFLAGKSKPC